MNCTLCGPDGDVARKYRLDSCTILECRTCGLVFQPGNGSGRGSADLYDESYFLERARYFFGNEVADPVGGKRDGSIESFESGLRILRRYRPGGGKLLDLGCGVGIFLKLAKNDGWDVMGTDVSGFAVRYAREKFGVEALQGTLEALRLPAESFDAVSLWDTIEHMEDPLANLREVRRLLKPDGIVILDTPNEAALLRAIARLLHRLSLGTFQYPVRKIYHQYHLYYYNRETIGRLLEAAGFTVLSITKNTIPIVKARGSRWEKVVVRILSLLERMSGNEYELLAVARRAPGPGGISGPS